MLLKFIELFQFLMETIPRVEIIFFFVHKVAPFKFLSA